MLKSNSNICGEDWASGSVIRAGRASGGISAITAGSDCGGVLEVGLEFIHEPIKKIIKNQLKYFLKSPPNLIWFK
jgi:hypothetical protein